jgi:hypothetical protein
MQLTNCCHFLFTEISVPNSEVAQRSMEACKLEIVFDNDHDASMSSQNSIHAFPTPEALLMLANIKRKAVVDPLSPDFQECMGHLLCALALEPVQPTAIHELGVLMEEVGKFSQLIKIHEAVLFHSNICNFLPFFSSSLRYRNRPSGTCEITLHDCSPIQSQLH